MQLGSRGRRDRKTAGRFEIAEHASAFGLACQALPVPVLPRLHLSDEVIRSAMVWIAMTWRNKVRR